MSRAKNIEWGSRIKEKDNVIHVSHWKSENNKDNESESLKTLTPRKPMGQNETNFYDPHIIESTNDLDLHRHTIFVGGGKMNNNNDWKYSELKEDLRESERRISQDIKEREQRFENMLERFANDSKEREERFMKNIEDIKAIVSDGEKNRRNTSIAMWTLAITTILGIAAMVITVVISV